MKPIRRTTSIEIIFIDIDRFDEELVLLKCGGETDFAFLDCDEFDLDVEFDGAQIFAQRFLKQLGWEKSHQA